MEAKGYDLGNCGILVNVEVSITALRSTNGEEKQKQHESSLPHIIAIVDTSGSMGSYVGAVLNGAIPSALLKQGYHLDTPIDVITFESTCTLRSDVTLRTLQSSFEQGSGSTCMSGIFSLLELIFRQKENHSNIHIVCVSDGLLDDGPSTVRAANALKEKMMFAANIEVTMIRLKTSQRGEPDTRALACLGQFTTSVHQAIIHDVDATICPNHNSVVDELINVIQQHIFGSSSKTTQTLLHSFKVESSTNNLRRSPLDVGWKELYFVPLPIVEKENKTDADNDTNNHHFFFLLPAYAKQQITIDGIVFPVQMQQKMRLPLLQQFCEYCMGRLKVQKVIGNDVTIMHHFFTKLDSFFSTSEEESYKNIQNRIQAMNNKYKKTIRTQLEEVLRLANQDRVSAMNAQQQADYLRTSTSTSLARRAIKNQTQQMERGEKDTIAVQTLNVLQAFQNEKSKCREINPDERSFYSVYNNEEAYSELLIYLEDENKSNLCDMQEFDILRLFGFLGICYHHTPGDVIDPYTFYIQQTFGANFLSLSDLRDANAKKINESFAELYAPSTSVSITGVIPLRFLNPCLFDILWQHGRKLLEMHSSINMRRMMAPVRSDLLGERIALLFYIMRNNGDLQKPISQYDQTVFADVLHQLKMLLQLPINKEEFAPIFETFQQQRIIRNDLIGANAISCIQKPMIALLLIADTLPMEYICNTLHVFYEFDAYHKARQYFETSEDRSNVIRELFQINENKILEAYPITKFPDIPLESVDGIYRHVKVREEVKKLVSHFIPVVINTEIFIDVFVLGRTLEAKREKEKWAWMPKYEHYNGYYRFLTQNHSVRTSSEEKQEITAADFVLPKRVWMLSLVTAVMCQCEQDRFNNGQSNTFEWNNIESGDSYMAKVHRQFYEDFYYSEAMIELKRRDDAELSTQIYLMVQTETTIDTFIENLQKTIPNREHHGYKLLVHDILLAEPMDSEKLFILLTGKEYQTDTVVFCQGNMDENIRNYQRNFSATMWDCVQELLKTSCYRYRGSNKPNSHGHCNSNPSQWALNWGLNQMNKNKK